MKKVIVVRDRSVYNDCSKAQIQNKTANSFSFFDSFRVIEARSVFHDFCRSLRKNFFCYCSSSAAILKLSTYEIIKQLTLFRCGKWTSYEDNYGRVRALLWIKVSMNYKDKRQENYLKSLFVALPRPAAQKLVSVTAETWVSLSVSQLKLVGNFLHSCLMKRYKVIIVQDFWSPCSE